MSAAVVLKRLVAPSKPMAPANSFERLQQLRNEIFCIPEVSENTRSLHSVLTRPSQGRMIKSHWEVKEIWDWPMSESMQWTNFKKLSIENKLQALGKRGKGPIARAEGKSAKAAGKKKRK